MEMLRAVDKKVNSARSGGLLSRADIATLKNIRNMPPSSHRKSTYKKWVCIDCKHEFFFMVRSCLLCESAGVAETTLQTRYQPASMPKESAISADAQSMKKSADKMPKLTAAFGE